MNRIAKQLVRIARELVAGSRDEEYRKFRETYRHGTGMWHRTPQYTAIAKFNREVDSNNVYGAYKALARYFKDKKTQVALSAIEKLHELQGHLTSELSALRRTYTEPLDKQMGRDTRLQQAAWIYDMQQYGHHKHGK